MRESERDGQAEDATLAAIEDAQTEARPAAPASDTAPAGDRGDLYRGDRVGRFEIQRLLGVGGMGAVYAARDHELHRNVALKVLHAGSGSLDEGSQGQLRILREAQAMAMVNHPHLVTIYDVGTHAGSVYLAMEYVEGRTLDAWLAGDPAYETIIDVFLQAGDALRAVHEAGLVHRDFKPGNVMVTGDDQVRVLDLGIARRRGARRPAAPDALPAVVERAAEQATRVDPEALARTLAGNAALGEADTVVNDELGASPREGATLDAFGGELTRHGAIVGTPRYMSPEQVRGLPAGPAADQFAFALCFVEALTGAHAFHGRGALVLMVSIDQGDRRPWPEAEPPSPEIRSVLDRALAAEPADRFASMADMLAEIRQNAGLRHQLRSLVERWIAHDESVEYLLPPGGRLAEARRILDEGRPLSPDERRFLVASLRKVRIGRIQRRVLMGGIASLALAVPPTLWLVDRRGRQLDAAMRLELEAQLRSTEDRLAPLLDGAQGEIGLFYDQRSVWIPLFTELASPGEATDPSLAGELEAIVAGLNGYFRPALERASLMSSSIIARGDGLEFLAFEDPDARHLDPPYDFYNRFVRPERYGKAAFEVFSGERGAGRSRWLAEGDPTTRGRPWGGYDPRGRPWYVAATRAPRSVVWTGPYRFFTSKDVGVTASIAWHDGPSDLVHVLAVDFMLNDLSRVTTSLDPPTFAALVTTSSQEVVALPADPRFATPEGVRRFYREFEADHHKGAGDLAPRLPRIDDLGIPSVVAAVAERGDAPVFRFVHEGERLWAGTKAIGPAALGLELWLVQRPSAS